MGHDGLFFICQRDTAGSGPVTQASNMYHSSSYHPQHSPSYPQHSYSHHQSHMYHQPNTYYYHPHYPSYESSHHYPSYYPSHYDHHDYHNDYHHHSSMSHHGESDGKGGLASVASLLVPLLGLIGLSLLVPNVVGLRAKREASRDPGDQQAQALMSIYTAVLSSEDCVRKLLCEMGQLARNAKDKPGLFKLIDRMAPPQFHQELSILKEASMASSYTCKKYSCHVTSKEKAPNVGLNS